ncbi:YpoC family protein [Bacillus salacetis]|uniref:YpoC family protein n=1 Tax=Bacillus salacetis TaxID=2315464 RepID=UPI003BA39ED2
MGKSKSLSVPKEVMHPLFYTENGEKVNVESQQPDPLNPVFSYEILFYNNLPVIAKPWEASSYIKKAEMKWQGIKEELDAAFSARSGDEIKSLMKKGIALFMMYLFWTNAMPSKPAMWKENLDKMNVKPVNVLERLSFVLMHHSLFHSYKQLDQLFIEQLKQYAKNQAMLKQK